VRCLRCWLVITFCFASAATSLAQKEKREPLTPAQVDQIREAGIYPDDRINLYTKFLSEHADTIKGLTSRGKSGARAQRLDGELQDLTALMDELGSNLDVYSDRKADIRKALKNLNEAAPKWLGILRALAGEPGFDLARKEAIESGEDLADQAKRLLSEQTDYFNLHKDEQGQERAEPK
jgi:maltooligosyltrehalose synthase